MKSKHEIPEESTSNQSAFPIDAAHGYTSEFSQGMTLRDYFAAKALQGWMANPSFVNNKQKYEYAVNVSYKIADVMLKQRNQ